MAFGDWWGMGGRFLAVLLFPGPLVFPFVAWIKEGYPNFWYFCLWILGMLGVVQYVYFVFFSKTYYTDENGNITERRGDWAN